MSAKLFAQQAPAGLVPNEGEKGIEEEMLCRRSLFTSTSVSEVPAKCFRLQMVLIETQGSCYPLNGPAV